MKILISRTDNIGDVILTLPLCGWIKENIEHAEVHFLCKKPTADIVKKSRYVDVIHIWDGKLPEVDAIVHVFPSKEIAKAAKRQKIAIRVGSSHRRYHLFTCNRLVNFSRIKSELHEAQLNFKLLRGLDISFIPKKEHLFGLAGWNLNPQNWDQYKSAHKFNLIFHIKSRGSAKEWRASNYLRVAESLPIEKFNIILTGTEAESQLINGEIPGIFELSNVVDTTGKLSLEQLIGLIESVDGLLACSTGPLHIASIAGKKALGLYPKKRPMHTGRWCPIGEESSFIEEEIQTKDKYLDVSIEKVTSKIINWIQA